MQCSHCDDCRRSERQGRSAHARVGIRCNHSGRLRDSFDGDLDAGLVDLTNSVLISDVFTICSLDEENARGRAA